MRPLDPRPAVVCDAGMAVRSIRILHRQAGEAMVAVSMDRNEEAMSLIDDLLVNRSS